MFSPCGCGLWTGTLIVLNLLTQRASAASYGRQLQQSASAPAIPEAVVEHYDWDVRVRGKAAKATEWLVAAR